jgi:flagellar L-ring protein FlgH
VRRLQALAACVAALSAPATAGNLYQGGSWPALAADRRAWAVGDGILIIVSESAQASNAVSKGSRKRTKIEGSIAAGHRLDEGAGLSLAGNLEGEGRSGRSDRVVARLSAKVDAVLPNGDLLVSGRQQLRVNGEATMIHVAGRLRSADIASDNTTLSSRLADAVVEYNGRGFTSRNARPGIIGQIFSFLGLL